MIQSAKVLAIEDKAGRIALSVLSEGSRIDDLALVRFAGDEYPVAVGSKVYLLPIAGADGEFVALPIRGALRTDARVVQGSTVIIAEDPSNAVALALFGEIHALWSAMNGHSHTYAPGMGAPILTSAAAAGPEPAGTQKVTAE